MRKYVKKKSLNLIFLLTRTPVSHKIFSKYYNESGAFFLAAFVKIITNWAIILTDS